MKNKLAVLLIGMSFLAVVWMYASGVWYAEPYARAIVLGLDEKPFVYRALLPWLAQGLMGLGLSASAALGVLVLVSAVGLVVGMKFLYETFKRK
jgi:hypothetical protein